MQSIWVFFVAVLWLCVLGFQVSWLLVGVLLLFLDPSAQKLIPNLLVLLPQLPYHLAHLHGLLPLILQFLPILFDTLPQNLIFLPQIHNLLIQQMKALQRIFLSIKPIRRIL